MNIEMTPTVHFDHDITLKIKIEVSLSQSGSVTISGVTEPIFAAHREQVIRLREGEASILGGIQDKQDQVSWSGIPGLSSIPHSEVSVRFQGPHDHRRRDCLPRGAAHRSLAGLDAGESAHHRHRRRAVDRAAPCHWRRHKREPSDCQRRYRILWPTQPNLGTVPGQSAAGAGPAALAQLRAAAVIMAVQNRRGPVAQRGHTS